MNSLVIEIVFCFLFIYFAVSTFTAEFFDGFLHSFICVFGPASLQETEDQNGFSIFYYSYVILLSILGNLMFILSLVIYGPILHKTETKVLPLKELNNFSQLNASNRVDQAIHFTYRRPKHICIFTRYDLYALIVLVFICIEFVFQQTMNIDDFKTIEGRIYMKTVDNYIANYTDENCYDKWCDDITGRGALQMIHKFHQEMHCCGWNDAKDWFKDDGLEKVKGEFKKNMRFLPNSCCEGLSPNCSVTDIHRFAVNCRNFELPIRDTINPTRYSNFCFGLYPLYKLFALIAYQFSFQKIFDGSSLLLRVNFILPPTVRVV